MSRNIFLYIPAVLVLFSLISMFLIVTVQAERSDGLTSANHVMSVEESNPGVYRVTERIEIKNKTMKEFRGHLEFSIQEDTEIFSFCCNVEDMGCLFRDRHTCFDTSRENSKVIADVFPKQAVPLSYTGQEENVRFTVTADNTAQELTTTLVVEGGSTRWENERIGEVEIRYPVGMGTEQMTKGSRGTPTYLSTAENITENITIKNTSDRKISVKFESNSENATWGLNFDRGENQKDRYVLNGRESKELELLGWSPNCRAILQLSYLIESVNGKAGMKRKLDYATDQIQVWVLRRENNPEVWTDLGSTVLRHPAQTDSGTWLIYQSKSLEKGYTFTLELTDGGKEGVGAWMLVLISAVVATSVFVVYKGLIEREGPSREPEVRAGEPSQYSSKVEMMVDALTDLRKDYEDGKISKRTFEELERRYRDKAKEFSHEG